jgi:ElaB/YqjD/DUF883 family membrane-anchored ribosome-binding protein
LTLTSYFATNRKSDMSTPSIADSINNLDTHLAKPMIDRAAAQADALAARGLEAVRDGSQRLRESARHASEGTVHYIQAEPLKSVLIAAATGAALMALVSLLSRSRGNH